MGYGRIELPFWIGDTMSDITNDDILLMGGLDNNFQVFSKEDAERQRESMVIFLVDNFPDYVSIGQAHDLIDKWLEDFD